MRKVVLYELMSLDGAVDEPWQYFPEFDDAMDGYMAQVIGSQDTVLLGRRMYDEWADYWQKPDRPQPFSDFINAVEKVVVTSSPLTTPWANSRAVAGPIETVVADLKARDGGDIGVHGSIQLAQSLLAADLIDEICLEVGPAAGFQGRRLFETTDPARRLELVTFDRSPNGTMLLGYRVRHTGD
ncbi:MAG TPA: dihydrofolate reductase family protein [Candidatus Limnocylindrales bacterium]|jgi:dihydrofolate reductase